MCSVRVFCSQCPIFSRICLYFLVRLFLSCTSCRQMGQIMRDGAERFSSANRDVSLKTGEAARPVHQPAAEWVIPGHSSAPLLSPRWYFSAAKCHINIRCRLINLSSHGTWWHLTSCWNTDGSTAEPLLLTHICPERSHCTAPVFFNTVQPHASFFLL